MIFESHSQLIKYALGWCLAQSNNPEHQDLSWKWDSTINFLTNWTFKAFICIHIYFKLAMVQTSTYLLKVTSDKPTEALSPGSAVPYQAFHSLPAPAEQTAIFRSKYL